MSLGRETLPTNLLVLFMGKGRDSERLKRTMPVNFTAIVVNNTTEPPSGGFLLGNKLK